VGANEIVAPYWGFFSTGHFAGHERKFAQDFALLAIAVGIAVGFSSIKAGDEYCPSPSPASVTSLFAPCQTFVAAVGHPVSKQEAVQMGLLTPDLQPAPATQLAHNLRSAPLPQSETGTGTVGLAKPGPKEIELSR